MRKKLFDIPIYSVSQKDFAQKYNAQFDGRDKDIVQKLKQKQYPQGIWIYNQIIGFVAIFMDKNDIIFEVHKHIGKIYPLSSKKQFMQNLHTTGLHFRIIKSSNYEIAEKIEQMLFEISKKYPFE